MHYRLIKQVIYGTTYLAVFFLIGWGIYATFIKPAPSCFDNRQNQKETGIDCGGPCESCEIKNLAPIEVKWSKSFPLNGQTAAVFEIRNPNTDYAAASTEYEATFIGRDGGPLKIIKKNTSVYASEIKYLLEGAELDSRSIAEVKLEFPGNTDWKHKDIYPTPLTQTRQLITKTNERKEILVSGMLLNNNPFKLNKARIIAFLKNSDGIDLSASKTELDNMNEFEERPFQINFPSSISLLEPVRSDTFYFNKNLGVGSEGSDVRALQNFLKGQGFFERDLSNYFGNVTQSALIKYQKQTGIDPANGQLGPKTRESINSELRKKHESETAISSESADPEKTRIYVEAIR